MSRRYTTLSGLPPLAESVYVSKVTTADAARSLKKLIEDNYRGRVTFSDVPQTALPLIFDEYKLAEMIRLTLRELTLKRTCDISFITEDGIFFIKFKANRDTPPSDKCIELLRAAAVSLGIHFRHSEFEVAIGVAVLQGATFLYQPVGVLKFLPVLTQTFASNLGGTDGKLVLAPYLLLKDSDEKPSE